MIRSAASVLLAAWSVAVAGGGSPAVAAAAAAGPGGEPVAVSGGEPVAVSGGEPVAVSGGEPSRCRGQVYLTLDTGNMRHARLIADILRRHRVRASFFVANETTDDGSGALEPAWAGYWRALVDDGHLFGSHTLDHVYFSAAPPRRPPAGAVPPCENRADGQRVRARPQFGVDAGQTRDWGAAEVCRAIDDAGRRFQALTGQPLSPLWRAPGGRGPQALFAMAARCGWRHVGWSPAGFLGDELPSDRFPNAQLLRQSLARIRDGDVLMAHLGIRSRADPYAPMLERLITGLHDRGFCFRTLAEHPLLLGQTAVSTPIPVP